FLPPLAGTLGWGAHEARRGSGAATGGPHPGSPPWNGGGSTSRAGPISANRVGAPSEPGERTGGSTQDQLATGLRGRARLRAMVMARITATTPSDHSTGIL